MTEEFKDRLSMLVVRKGQTVIQKMAMDMAKALRKNEEMREVRDIYKVMLDMHPMTVEQQDAYNIAKELVRIPSKDMVLMREC